MTLNEGDQTKAMERRDSAIYFCDHPVAVSPIDFKNLSKEKRDAIRRLHERKDERNLRILVFFGVWAVCGYASLTVDLLAVRVLSCLAIVCSLVGCSVLLHEASHGLLFRNPFLNRWVGFLCGLPVILSISGFRTNHLAHHERRGSAKRSGRVEGNFRDSTSSALVYYASILVRAYGFLFYLPVIGLFKGSWNMRIRALTEYGIIVSCSGIVFWSFSLESVLNLWIYPLLISAHITELRAVAEHGLTTRGNALTASRTVLSNRVVSYLMCNINFHLEHHLFPGVPWYNLPRIHALLGDGLRRGGSSVYRSYTEFFVDFFKASCRGIIPNSRIIPEETRRTITG